MYERLETFEHDGLQFAVEIARDDDAGAPWEECDGHGPVRREYCRSGRVNKAPGERVLHSHGGDYWLYDVAEAVRIALRDGWGLPAERVAEKAAELGRPPTCREIAAEAAGNDFAYLRRWLNNDWFYAVVRVVLLDVEGAETDRDAYCGGVEFEFGGADEYWREVAEELAAEIADDVEGVDVLPGQRIRETEGV